jgi:maltose O-acetyltransferase
MNRILQIIKSFITSFRISLCNLLINMLPDDSISSQLRVFVAKILGLKCSHNIQLRRGIFYGNLKHITIGSHTIINREVFFDAYDQIKIGKNVGIAFRAVFITSTHNTENWKDWSKSLIGAPITIEDSVWIGAGAMIGPGVTIGTGSIVATGAVVMRSMPAHSMIVGNPARVIKKLAE